jgi:hypothetical protein
VGHRGMRIAGRCLAGAALSFLAVVLLPATASASFHLNSIREVFPGSSDSPGAEYIELQMYAAGQNHVAGHEVREYASDGYRPEMLENDVASGENQRTILLATEEAEAKFGFTADMVILPGFLDPAGGAVCFDSIDCVAWGNFDTSAILPSPAGANAPAITDVLALTRSITPGCATLLEASDDTNDSAADFLEAAPHPRPNSSSPIEHPCAPSGGSAPQTKIDSGPKKKTKSSKAKFTFSSTTGGAKFQCSLDDEAFASCESPLKLKHIKPGKHELAVRAIADGVKDKSPDSYRWKRKPKHKHHK